MIPDALSICNPVSGATLAIHPARIAIDVVLFLPDRQTYFDLIDDEATGLERLVPMGRGNTNPYRTLTEFKQADAMHAAGIEIRKTLLRLCQHFLTLGNDQGFIRLILEALDNLPFIFVANPTFEGAVPARCMIRERTLQLRRIYGCLGYLDHVNHQQPVETAGLCHRLRWESPSQPCGR